MKTADAKSAGIKSMAQRAVSGLAVSGLLAFGLSACATLSGAPASTSHAPQETIAYSVGPCFGFCPVYSASVTPAGRVEYKGERHTAVLGNKAREGGARSYTAMSRGLADFRPATGTTAQTQCDQRTTDQQHYRIIWTAVDGTQTVLEHDKGCRSARNDMLNKALDGLPGKLGIGDWVKQTTRPGESRG